MRRPDLLYRFCELGCDLIVPSHVEREELIDENVRVMICDLVDHGTIRIVRMNERGEALNFGAKFRGMDLGESDAILTCIKMRRAGQEARCVLDDKKARAAARLIGIRHIGLAGLLGELASAGTVTAHEMDKIIATLRRSDFHIRDDLLDGIARGI